MVLLILMIGVISGGSVCVVTANADHDLFLKEARFHELGVQIHHLHEKLYVNCPYVFHAPDSASGPIIGRRSSVEETLDLQIELAEKILEDLILTYRNCTKAAVMTLRTSTETHIPTASTRTTTKPLHTTTHPRKFSFSRLCFI